MLALNVNVVDEKIHFVVSLEGGQVSAPVLQFIWPVMGLEELRLMISGRDCEDQNNEGVWVKMKDKVLKIQLHRGENDDEIVVINLPHVLIADEKVFGPMLDAYEAYWSKRNLGGKEQFQQSCEHCGRCATCWNLSLCEKHQAECSDVESTCRCGEEDTPANNTTCEGDCGACEKQPVTDCSQTGVCESKVMCRDNCKW